MKAIYILSAFAILLFSSQGFADETQKYRAIKQSLFYIEVEDWIFYVGLVKNDQEIPPYMRFDKPSKYEKSLLKNYNISTYENKLIARLSELMSLEEIQKANKLLKNPFIIKILQNIDYSYFQQKSIHLVEGKIHPKLKPLIMSIYNLLGYKKIMQLEYKSYQKKYSEKLEVSKILARKKSIKLLSLNEFKEKYLLFLYSRLKETSVSELREFVRVVRNENEFLKFNQIMNAFHFSIIFKLQESFYEKQRSREQSGIKIE